LGFGPDIVKKITMIDFLLKPAIIIISKEKEIRK